MQELINPNKVVQNDLKIAVDYFKGIDGVKRLIVFGGVAKGREPDFRSDLDLCVVGLPEEKHYRVIGDLGSKLSLPLDLIRYEDADASLLLEIEKWGVCIYEADI